MAMDTPVLKCCKFLCAEFHKYATDGIAKGKQVEDFVEANLMAWMKNADKEVVDKVKSMIDTNKEKGIDKQTYPELMCHLLKVVCNNKVVVKENPEEPEASGSS